MTTSEELLKIEALEQARADLFAEELEQVALEDIDELLRNPESRDEEVFDLVGAPVDETIDDYENVPVVDRNFGWMVGLSALAVAARLQVLSSSGEGLLKLFDSRQKRLVGLDISNSDLKSAARAGISKKEIKAAKKSLVEVGDTSIVSRVPSRLASNVPSVESLGKLSRAELLETLEEYGIVAPWNTLQTQAAAYVSRMTEYQPGSLQFKAAVADLISSESKSGLVSMVRRATQQYTTLVEIDGNPNQELIWIVEGDENTCKNCKANAAEIKTYKEWVKVGLPGSATCLGGDRCRCDLLAVDKEDDIDANTVINEALVEEPSLDIGEKKTSTRRRAVPRTKIKKQSFRQNKPAQREFATLPRTGKRVDFSQQQSRADANTKFVAKNLKHINDLTAEERQDYMRWSWVNGSHSKGSLNLKTAAKEEFGLSGTIMNPRNFAVEDSVVDKLKKDARDIYEKTQDDFAKKGIKEVTLYRGVKNQTSMSGAVQSWTSDVNVAKKFGKFIIEEKIPVDQILTSVDSPDWLDGVWGEQKEFIVLQ